MGKAKYKDVESEMQAILLEAHQLRTGLTRAVTDDAAAYEAVMAAYRLPKDTEVQAAARDAAVQSAMLEAARVPYETATDALRVLELSARCASKANVNAISDALSGAAMARAALTAAGYNVRINLHHHPDTAARDVFVERPQGSGGPRRPP